MSIFHGTLESALRFHRFHERLNHSIKVQNLALGLLENEIAAGASPGELVGRAMRRPGWIWGGPPNWTQSSTIIADTRRDAAQSAVARAFSAFDLFVDELMAEIARWESRSGFPVVAPRGGKREQIGSEGEADKVDKLYERLGAPKDRVKDIWPVYRYFRLARDCIVHRDGTASPALEAHYDEIGPSKLKHWFVRYPAPLPPVLVPAVNGSQLDFNLRQAIAASSALRRIAIDLNRIVVEKIGRRGFVYLAAHQLLFQNDYVFSEIHQTDDMLSALSLVLSTRYRVNGVLRHDCSKYLRELGVETDCKNAFAQIKRTSRSSTNLKKRSKKVGRSQQAVDSIITLLDGTAEKHVLVDPAVWLEFLGDTRLTPDAGAKSVIYRGVEIRLGEPG